MTGVISAYRSPAGEYAGIEYAALPVKREMRCSTVEYSTR